MECRWEVRYYKSVWLLAASRVGQRGKIELARTGVALDGPDVVVQEIEDNGLPSGEQRLAQRKSCISKAVGMPRRT